MKNGKPVFKQKALVFEKMSETLQGRSMTGHPRGALLNALLLLEIVKFREMLEQRIDSKAAPLTAIPDEHRPLIAKLVHERSVRCTHLV